MGVAVAIVIVACLICALIALAVIIQSKPKMFDFDGSANGFKIHVAYDDEHKS